jgi:cyclase
MEIVEVSPGVIAFVRPDEGANVGLIRTADGVIIVDTTSSPPDMQELLDAAGVLASEARLVINTHSHSDHTWGNQLFGCPILSHRLCRERMVANLAGPWSTEAIQASIAEGEKTDPDWAREAREKLADLRITLPTEVFDDRRKLEIGGVRLEVIHLGAHTPGTAVVWLPAAKVLFAGDLIFEGRYPYLGDADVPALIAALKRLPEFGAQVIVPGHGVLCGEAEIAALVDYLETAWALTADHLAQGHSEDEAVADPNYPRYGEGTTERLRENIQAMYAQLASSQKHGDQSSN